MNSTVVCPFIGLDPLRNCSSFAELLSDQFTAMRVLCIVIAGLGLVLAVALLIEHLRDRMKMSTDLLGDFHLGLFRGVLDCVLRRGSRFSACHCRWLFFQ